MSERNEFEWRPFLFRLIISVLVIGALLVLAYFILKSFGVTDLTTDSIREYVDSAGAVAPLLFILISFLQVTFVPIPGAVTIVAGYLCFGFWESFLYSYIGMMAGSLFAYFLGRLLGRPFVVWLAGGAERVDFWISKLKGRENLLLFFMFFLPLFPDDLLCSVAGLIPQRPLTFVIMQLITRTTSIGATLISTTVALRGWPFLLIIILGALLLIPIFIWCYINIEKVNDFFLGIGRRITGRPSTLENENTDEK